MQKLFRLLVSGMILFTWSAWGRPLNLDPQAQARAHASLWSIWRNHERIQQDCNFLLVDPSSLNLKMATEQLLERLVGQAVPTWRYLPENQIPTWIDFESLSKSDREAIAYRIMELQPSYDLKAPPAYTFGHTVYGAENIRRYSQGIIKEYEAILKQLEQHQAYTTAQNVITNIRLALRGSLAIGASIGGALLGDQIAGDLGFLAGMIGGFGISMIPSLLPGMSRVASYLDGDEGYQRQFAEARGADGRILEVLKLTQTSMDRGASFFTSADFHILSTAFDDLKRGASDAAESLARSCRIHSPGRPCDEYMAVREANYTDKYGYIGGAIATARESTRTGQKAIALSGRVANAFFFDQKTGQPVLISWVKVELSPNSNGNKKPKESRATQTQELRDWGGQWAPAPVPVRAR